MKTTRLFWKLLLTLCLVTGFNSNSFANQDASENQLSIGDKLYLHLPGEPEFDDLFQIELSGKINLPEIGKVHLAGKNIKAAEQSLKLALSVAYIELSQFYIEVRKREKIVTVLGYVNEPMQVKVPEYGNVQMVLNQAKGLKPGAQLDKFQIRRNGEVLVFNYKAYLDSGDIQILPDVQSGDVLFVPASPLIGNVQVEFDSQTLASGGDASASNKAVTLFGELHSPGTFSYKSGMSLIDALMRADGVTRYADVTKIRVIQNNLDKNSEPSTFDLKAYLDSGNNDLLPQVYEGTTIYVPIMVDDVDVTARTVYIMGEVQKPGSYEAPNNVSFMDILANAGGPTRFAETRQIRLLKESGETIHIDLQKYSENHSQNILPPIVPGDVIFVPEKTDINEKSWLKIPSTRAVKVMGAVHHPGRYEWSNEMDLMDLLAHAGGPLKGANLTDIKIVKKGDTKQSIIFNLTQFVETGGEYALLPEIVAGDTIVVEELPHDPKDNKSQWIRQSSEKSIYVIGQVGAPGRYAFSSELHFLDILAAADGTNSNADIRNIRVTHRNGHGTRVSKVDLALYFETGDETLLPKVLPGDTLYFPEKQKNWLQTSKNQVVRLMGSVQNTGRYDFDDSMTLLDLLAESGGPTADAMIDKIVVVNNGGLKEQSRVFDLEDYVKNPDPRKMPLLRAGDTVYVPGQDENTWRNRFRDAWDVIAIVALVAGL
ncbi:SLBB domain-containing protein [Catenovulum maritimum]|uniref:Sugar ABC transporter substrate-binding protein n=1 Tax=Catenovulum maritimum TaxID=1513271 RepID=A0A0J8GZ48_9ALTE|nr:SLBB domain-containing protein [Catenovulum maritimum]KMT66499.1 sugar ABC transporter substrate-binding protein [Catenovulum maritimum]